MTIAEQILRAKDDYDAVYEAGRQKEYDDFWDTYQNYGDRTAYDNAFAEATSGTMWVSGVTYRPKYPIKPTSANAMYYATRLPYEVLNEVDFSNCKDFYNAFAYSTIKRLGVIDMSKATRTAPAFDNCNSLHTIDKIISSTITAWASTTFRGCASLENLFIEGIIAKSFSAQDCTKLSKASIISIINALSSTTSGLTTTLSQEAVNNAFTTAEWEALEATKTNWTISLL